MIVIKRAVNPKLQNDSYEETVKLSRSDLPLYEYLYAGTNHRIYRKGRQ